MVSMIRNRLKILVPAVILMIIAFSSTVFAAGYVYDDAGLFYEIDITGLQTQAKELSDKTGWDVIVATTSDAQGKTAAAYADDYYNTIGGENGVLYLVDMDNGELYISTSGQAINYLTDKRIATMLDSAIGYAYDGDFYQAVSDEISMTSSYYDAGIPNTNERTTSVLTVVAAAIIVGAIVSGTAVFIVKKNYGFKSVGNVYEYTTKSSVNLTVKSDNLVNSFVTTRIRPKPQNNNRGGGGFGGGSTTHTSSGGRVHGGGGRSFR